MDSFQFNSSFTVWGMKYKRLILKVQTDDKRSLRINVNQSREQTKIHLEKLHKRGGKVAVAQKHTVALM